MEYVSPEGLRLDGRRPMEMRQIRAQVGVVAKADGSASFEMGNTKVIAAVYGPREVENRSQQMNDQALVRCEYSMANFSTGDRMRKPKGDRRSTEISLVIRQTMEACILTNLMPRSQIDIFVQVLQADGGTRSACINAATLALADAGIPMRDLITSCSAGYLNGTPLLDQMDIIGRHQGMMEEVGNLLKEKSSLETIVAELSVDLDDAQRKLQSANSALEMEKNDKLSKEKDRDDAIRMLANVLSEKLEMKKEKDCVVKEAEELRVREAGMLFSLTQLEEATNRFDPGHKIGQGAAGTVYKGRIAQTVVAIKKLNDVRVLQCGHPLQQEMRGIYMIRHPRLVAQIGACLQPPILVYEYLPNGNLRDRLNGSDPLPWQIRIRIAAEICDALLFLHSVAIYHGNLTPNNVLLDPNLHAKIDLGFCAPIKKQNPDPKDWDPMGPLYYTDPETRSTGALTTKSDAYSFGAILLEMLTGRPGVLVPDQPDPEEVDEGYLEGVLDPSAGAWPFIQAVQLANLGLRCCSSSAESRPNLQSEVWKVLDTIRSSSTSMAGFHGPDGSRRPPDYFVCPITQEIMSDPHIAADGYTYEKEALHGWLEGGRANSPMTNLPLSHLTLTPNYALRSAIQEWQDRP